MLQYLLSATTIWLVSLLLFDLFLRKESHHSYNRYYLLLTFLAGCTLPLWQNGNSLYDRLLQQIPAIPDNWIKWLMGCYALGTVVALLLLILDVVKLVIYYNSGSKSRQDGWTIIETGKQHPPFSYLDVVFVSGNAAYSVDEWNMILNHEKQHSVQLHLVDLVVMQLAKIVFWFHPLVYIYNYQLLLVHEYQADKASSPRPQEYGKFLIEQAVLQSAPSFSHSFNRSPIKNRILMLTKNAAQRTGAVNLKLLLVLPLTLLGILFFTKNSYSENKIKPGAGWKKEVARVIDISGKKDTVIHHLRDVSPDATLLEMIVKEIKSGKLTAYTNRDDYFSTKLTIEALNKILPQETDTFFLTDPSTGEKMTKFVNKEFDYAAIHKYRILEEWVYNPGNGKTEIEITGIAPIRNIYGCDGSFHGHQAMFYLRYNDIKNILSSYDLYHPNNTLASHIWDDYFNAEEEKIVKE